MTKPVRIFINGFGRIGRTVLRQVLRGQALGQVEVVGLNDIAPLETCAYLLRYDSVFGLLSETVEAKAEQLSIGDLKLPFYCKTDISALDLNDVDVVLECTGKVNSRAAAEAGLTAGAKSVVISGPSEFADQTIVLGANEELLGDVRTISNSSCTTNAIAPLLRALDQTFSIKSAHVTTIHCYTGSQPTVDQPGASLERSRAAAVSMVPTTTSAANQVTHVLPEFEGRLSVAAVRVPSISVSAIDAVFQIAEPKSGDMRDLVRDAIADVGIIGITDDPCVSTDMRARPESLVVALPEIHTVNQHQLRLFGWYDNEWGYSARMIDLAKRLASRVN